MLTEAFRELWKSILKRFAVISDNWEIKITWHRLNGEQLPRCLQAKNDSFYFSQRPRVGGASNATMGLIRDVC